MNQVENREKNRERMRAGALLRTRRPNKLLGPSYSKLVIMSPLSRTTIDSNSLGTLVGELAFSRYNVRVIIYDIARVLTFSYFEGR